MSGAGGGIESGSAAEPARRAGAALAGPLVLALLGAALAARTWRTWPDPLVDFGRELYAAWRIAEGERLHDDLAWLQGPLSAWVNGAWFALVGPSVMALVALNLAWLAAGVALAYRLLARLDGRLAATVAGALFLTVFAFARHGGIGNYQFATPYSHELTHGFVLSLAVLAALERALRGGGRTAALLAGLAFGAVLLTKAEAALAGGVGAAALFALAPARGRARLAGAFALAALLPPLAAWVAFTVRLEETSATAALLAPYRNLARPELRALPFYRAGMGLDAPAARAAAMLEGALALCALFALPLALAHLWRAGWGGRRLAELATGVATAGFSFLAREEIDWLGVARPLPLLLAAILVASVASRARARGGRERHERAALRAALAAFGLAWSAKILLNARLSHYGFVLALPGTLLVAASLLGAIPRALDARGRAGGFVRAAALGAFAVLAALHLDATRAATARQTHPLGQGADRFLADRRGALAAEALEAIDERLPLGGTLLVLPEGVMLNYLARRRTPARHLSFMPPELIVFGEERIVRDLQASPPALVVLVHKDTSEYGVPVFGRDYGSELWRWVGARYRETRVFGTRPFQDARFGIALYEPRP